mmetsp:Transcript_48674/g.115663  ORF Transcript_48674/g.115663 Transcript_48674/m.115663 type:complete len:112 (+) Transcript_48674:211-546(+)
MAVEMRHCVGVASTPFLHEAADRGRVVECAIHCYDASRGLILVQVIVVRGWTQPMDTTRGKQQRVDQPRHCHDEVVLKKRQSPVPLYGTVGVKTQEYGQRCCSSTEKLSAA